MSGYLGLLFNFLLVVLLIPAWKLRGEKIASSFWWYSIILVITRAFALKTAIIIDVLWIVLSTLWFVYVRRVMKNQVRWESYFVEWESRACYHSYMDDWLLWGLVTPGNIIIRLVGKGPRSFHQKLEDELNARR